MLAENPCAAGDDVSLSVGCRSRSPPRGQTLAGDAADPLAKTPQNKGMLPVKRTLLGRLRLCCMRLVVVAAVLAAVFAAVFVYDEILAVKVFGAAPRTMGDGACQGGRSLGAAAQQVCLLDDRVVKVPRACTNSQDVFACKWRLWKQRYTNRQWDASYAKLPYVADVVHYDGTLIAMERVRHHDVPPQLLANKLRMQELDLLLEKNGHIMLDVAPRSNAFLDERGRFVLVDFNLIPAWARDFVERYDPFAQRLEPYRNIYGLSSMLDWIAE